jgi:hypothetical protein
MRAKQLDIIGNTTVTTTVDEHVYNEVVATGNLSQAIRTAYDAWVGAYCPLVPAPFSRKHVSIGCYMTEDDYYSTRAIALSRRWSIAKTLRTALNWYYYHRS